MKRWLDIGRSTKGGFCNTDEHTIKLITDGEPYYLTASNGI